MNTIIAKRCSFCGKARTAFTAITRDQGRVGICLACAKDAVCQLAKRYHAVSTDLARGLADRKAGRMYPLSDVMRDAQAPERQCCDSVTRVSGDDCCVTARLDERRMRTTEPVDDR